MLRNICYALLSHLYIIKCIVGLVTPERKVSESRGKQVTDVPLRWSN